METSTTRIYTLSLHDALPISYPRSCWPQAWSASAVILTMQALLGLYPFAPARTLAIVRPRLPRGVDAIDILHLRVDRKSTRLNSSHGYISYAVFCLKKKNLYE